MMKRLVMALVFACIFLGSIPAWAVMYIWTDPDGSYHATDRIDRVPSQYREIIRIDTDNYVSPSGIGFERDHKGNVQFFDHSSPARKATRRNPPLSLGGPPGSPVTQEQLDEIKRRYRASGKEPRPEVVEEKVSRIITGDTFELENGQKVTFIGIEFPDELKGETPIHKEAIEYQRKLMQGRMVKLLFGPQRFDEKGRLLAYVFIGTDMFVNADLVMNGYARVKTVPPNSDYRALFLRLEDFAQKSMLGMWDKG